MPDLPANVWCDPEMRQAMRRMAEIAAGDPDRFDLPPVEGRRIMERQRRPWNADPPALHAVEDVVLPGPFGDVPVRLYHPDARRGGPALAYLHGGGWVFGSLDTHDKILRRLALAAGRAVVGIDYALAPEHRFPDPVIEVAAVFQVLGERGAALGIDGGRLALGGDSAGANLALAAAMDLRDRARPRPTALVLFYGVFDSDLDTESHRTFGKGEFGLTRDQMDWFWRAYQRAPRDRLDPLAAPARGDLAGLPPMHLLAAGLDPLRDDTLALAARLAGVGARHELRMAEGVCHGFLGLTDMVARARTAIEDAGRFLNAVDPG